MTTYYIHPSGDDSNAGTDAQHPLKRWEVALAKLNPGDILAIMPGAYTQTTNSIPRITDKIGTLEAPITIKAYSERQACLQAAVIPTGAGHSLEAMRLDNCAYLNIEGLLFQGDGVTASDFGGLLHVYNSQYINIRRCVAQKTTKASNLHCILIQGYPLWATHDVLVEECEVYNFHRHGISAVGATDVTFRRNYANGNPCAKLDVNGDERTSGFVFYPARRCIMENNISENNFGGFLLKGVGGDGSGISDNLLTGNISLNDHHSIGLAVDDEASPPQISPYNIQIENQLIADPGCAGMLLSPGVMNLQVVNLSLFAKLNPNCDEKNYKSQGLIMVRDFPDEPGPKQGNLADSVIFKNVLVLRFYENQPCDTQAVRPAFNLQNYAHCTIKYTISYCSNPNFPPPPDSGSGHTLALFQTGGDDPNRVAGNPLGNGLRVGLGYGDCMIHIPAGNPNLHQMGEYGADIGANILYRYENGKLTRDELWGPITGAFPCGVDVVDKIGTGDQCLNPNRCQNVHERLHVGTAGRNIFDRAPFAKFDEVAIDPLALLLRGDAYVRLTLPDPPPIEALTTQIRQVLQAMQPEERRRALARFELFRTYASVLAEEIRGG